MNEINLLKNNDERIDTDVEWMQEFYEFLQGMKPKGAEPGSIQVRHQLNLSKKKAFGIIYYLQEHFPVFPDHIEVCWDCGSLFDDESEGLYWETKGRFYCGDCDYNVPLNYDKGRR